MHTIRHAAYFHINHLLYGFPDVHYNTAGGRSHKRSKVSLGSEEGMYVHAYVLAMRMTFGLKRMRICTIVDSAR